MGPWGVHGNTGLRLKYATMGDYTRPAPCSALPLMPYGIRSKLAAFPNTSPSTLGGDMVLDDYTSNAMGLCSTLPCIAIMNDGSSLVAKIWARLQYAGPAHYTRDWAFDPCQCLPFAPCGRVIVAASPMVLGFGTGYACWPDRAGAGDPRA
jgi:hypothetical protein